MPTTLTQTVTAITLPRWLETTDRTPGEDRFERRRTHHYVLSPTLSAEDAGLIADALDRRAALERNTALCNDLSGPALIVGVVGLLVVVLMQWPLWLALVVGASLLLFEQFRAELNVLVRRPLDLRGVQEGSDATLFYEIHPTEYHQALRMAKRSEAHAEAVHLAMWRAYDLRALAARAKEEFEVLVYGMNRETPESRDGRKKVNALVEAAQEAHEALLTTIDPSRRTSAQAAESLTELSKTIDAALDTYREAASGAADTTEATGGSTITNIAA